MSKLQRGFTIVETLIGLIVIFAISASGYAVYNHNHKKLVASVTPASKEVKISQQKSSTKHSTSKSAKTGSNKTSSLSAPITPPVIQTVNCGDEACFEKNFKGCKSATLTTGFGGSIKNSSVVVYYKINGPKNSGCSITFHYTKNPNPAVVNKDLTCIYNNKLSFENALNETFTSLKTCEGPLLPFIRG